MAIVPRFTAYQPHDAWTERRKQAKLSQTVLHTQVASSCETDPGLISVPIYVYLSHSCLTPRALSKDSEHRDNAPSTTKQQHRNCPGPWAWPA